MTTIAIILASIMGTIQIVCQVEFVVAVVISNSFMVDGIFTLHSILTHKPTAKEEQGSLELNFMQEVCSLF